MLSSNETFAKFSNIILPIIYPHIYSPFQFIKGRNVQFQIYNRLVFWNIWSPFNFAFENFFEYNDVLNSICNPVSLVRRDASLSTAITFRPANREKISVLLSLNRLLMKLATRNSRDVVHSDIQWKWDFPFVLSNVISYGDWREFRNYMEIKLIEWQVRSRKKIIASFRDCFFK